MQTPLQSPCVMAAAAAGPDRRCRNMAAVIGSVSWRKYLRAHPTARGPDAS